jgi:hypothetical protein
VSSWRRRRRISSINSRITLARIVVSPPNPSASYSASRRESGSRGFTTTRTYVHSSPRSTVAGRDHILAGRTTTYQHHRMGFYVYDNTRNRRARVHRSSCSWCNDGRGRDGMADPDNGRFYGPFATYREAASSEPMRTRNDTGDCGHCAPSA